MDLMYTVCHRPSSKGTKPLLQVIKATINHNVAGMRPLSAQFNSAETECTKEGCKVREEAAVQA